LAKPQKSAADDIDLTPGQYQQKAFVDLAIEYVMKALRDRILVAIILLLFLVNFRTTFIKLTDPAFDCESRNRPAAK